MKYIPAMSGANCFCLLAKTGFLRHTWYVHGTSQFSLIKFSMDATYNKANVLLHHR